VEKIMSQWLSAGEIVLTIPLILFLCQFDILDSLQFVALHDIVQLPLKTIFHFHIIIILFWDVILYLIYILPTISVNIQLARFL